MKCNILSTITKKEILKLIENILDLLIILLVITRL